jgi:hypothetical protein
MTIQGKVTLVPSWKHFHTQAGNPPIVRCHAPPAGTQSAAKPREIDPTILKVTPVHHARQKPSAKCEDGHAQNPPLCATLMDKLMDELNAGNLPEHPFKSYKVNETTL